MARLLLYLFLWIGSMGLAIFTGQNIALVTIKLASLESIKLPLGLVLTFCAGLGAIAATLLQTSIRFSLPSVPKSIAFKSNLFTSQKSTKAAKTSPTNEKKQNQTRNQMRNQTSNRQKSGNDFDDDWDDDWD